MRLKHLQIGPSTHPPSPPWRVTHHRLIDEYIFRNLVYPIFYLISIRVYLQQELVEFHLCMGFRSLAYISGTAAYHVTRVCRAADLLDL